MNYGHGTLSLEAFQRRLDEAFDATEQQTLVALTEDLDLEVDAGYVSSKREELGFHQSDETQDIEYMVCIFGGSDRTGRWTAPKEIRVFALFGGGDIDFSEARFTSRITRVRIVCIFGGVDVFVPEGINTTVNTFCIFGGVTNKAPNSDAPEAPRLIVEGLVLFGGAVVKIRKTMRERLMDFADTLRSMFGDTGAPPR
jgi:hypothetical protein